MQILKNNHMTLNKNSSPFKFLSNLKMRLIVVYILNLIDLAATALWISMFGTDVEANPIARWMFETNSIYIFKAVVVAACLYFLNKFLPKKPQWMWISWVLLAGFAALTGYHIFLGVRLLQIFSII